MRPLSCSLLVGWGITKSTPYLYERCLFKSWPRYYLSCMRTQQLSQFLQTSITMAYQMGQDLFLPNSFYSTIYQSFYNQYYTVQNSNIIIQWQSQLPESSDKKGTTLQVIPNVPKYVHIFTNITFVHRYSCGVTIVLLLKWLKMLNF